MKRMSKLKIVEAISKSNKKFFNSNAYDYACYNSFGDDDIEFGYSDETICHYLMQLPKSLLKKMLANKCPIHDNEWEYVNSAGNSCGNYFELTIDDPEGGRPYILWTDYDQEYDESYCR